MPVASRTPESLRASRLVKRIPGRGRQTPFYSFTFGQMRIGSKVKAFVSAIAGTAVAVVSSALTYSGGLVTFDSADNTAVNSAVGSALSNLWAGFTFVLPYIGIALGIVLVIGTIMYVVKRAGGASRG